MKRITLVTLFLYAICSLYGQRLTDLVDTRVGTSVAVTKTAGMFGQGTEEFAHTLPAVLAPFGMNFWTPETRGTELKGVCPYLYADNMLRGFRCSHWIVGGCTQDYGSYTLSPWKDVESQPYSHAREVAQPHYYSVGMQGVKAEMTATQRCGFLRFTYDNAEDAYLTIRVNSDENEGDVWVDTLSNSIYLTNPCHRIYQGKGNPTGTTAWACIKLNHDIAAYGKQDKQTMWVKLTPCHEVLVKASCSFTGIGGAEMNMTAELPGWDFDHTAATLRNVWEQKLGQITISSATNNSGTTTAQPDTAQLRTFYTAMYHSSFLPHTINDADGRYPKFADGTPMQLTDTQHDYYDDFSMWDTYRAQHPLLVLLDPKRDGDMMQSLVLKYQQGGWLPIFPCWNSYTAAMIGDHCTAALADAYIKGIRNFDIVKAYEGMRRNAFDTPASLAEYQDGMGRRALPSYLQYGYIPLEDNVDDAYHKQEQTSRTLEYAYDDYALAQMARAMLADSNISDADLKRCQLDRRILQDDYKALMARSHNWQNVFNPHTGWVGGRHQDGTFATTADIHYIKEPHKHPEATRLTPTTFSTFITEGTPVHYTWYVPHDIDGLARAMGGRRKMEARLDSMFIQGWYWHGNEPCHQIAYLYSAIGRQDKAAQTVQHIMRTEYMDAPGGLSGNDDAGQMSAWYIFSTLGFYPVCPATPYYYLSRPAFCHITLHLPNGKTLTIKSSPQPSGTLHQDRIYLNGKKLKTARISHEQIMQGGVLEFK